jgi:hypothetical protein
VNGFAVFFAKAALSAANHHGNFTGFAGLIWISCSFAAKDVV